MDRWTGQWQDAQDPGETGGSVIPCIETASSTILRYCELFVIKYLNLGCYIITFCNNVNCDILELSDKMSQFMMLHHGL